MAKPYRKWYCSAKGEIKITYLDQLREIANDQYGFVSTKEAAEIGVPPVELRKLAARGALMNVRRGVYRFTDARRTSRDVFAEAVKRVGDDAFLEGEAVLALLNLALVEPKRIRVGSPRRVRQKDSAFVTIIERKLPPEALTTYEDIPSVTVAQALIDSKTTVMPDRLKDAFVIATRRGLISPNEAIRVRKELKLNRKPKSVLR